MKTNRITAAGGLLWLALLLLAVTGGCARAGNGNPTGTPSPTVTPSATPRLDVTLVTRPPATVAFTQVTPTPLPTATPTPTPTPIVYQIQEGDTLLALAIDQGSTVDEITALNPGIRPNLLQIGQQIVLPPPATPIFGAGPTAVPINIEVLSVAQYETPVGSVWLMGEVVNNGALAAENVEVGIGLNGSDGTPLGTAAAWVLPPVLPPGARGTFALLLNEAPSPLGRPTVSVTAGQTVVDLGDRYLEFRLEDLAFEAGEESASVSGVIRNGGAVTASGVTVLVTVLDEAGQVSGARQLLLEGVVPAGEAVDFSLTVAPPGPPPVDYRVAVYGLRAP